MRNINHQVIYQRLAVKIVLDPQIFLSKHNYATKHPHIGNDIIFVLGSI